MTKIFCFLAFQSMHITISNWAIVQSSRSPLDSTGDSTPKWVHLLPCAKAKTNQLMSVYEFFFFFTNKDIFLI